MNKKVNKIKNWIDILIIFSVTLLVLISLVPWISTVENNNQAKFYNYEMMKTSDSYDINQLASSITNIKLVVWSIIIISIISFIAASFFYLRKLRIITNIIFLISPLTLVLSSYLTIKILRLIIEIVNLNSIHLAFFHKFFGYSFLILIFVFLVLFSSLTVSINSVSFLIKNLPKLRKKDKTDFKKDQRLPYDKYYKEKDTIKLKDASKTLAYSQKINAEEWSVDVKRVPKISLTDEVPEEMKEEEFSEEFEIAEDNIEVGKKEKTTEEKIDEVITAEKTTTEKKSITEPEKPVEERPTETEEKEKTVKEEKVRVDGSFEDVLNSAIEKKKKEKIQTSDKSTTTATRSGKKEITNKRYKIKCSKCKNVFTVELGKDNTKIKCPKCGKEGNIK